MLDYWAAARRHFGDGNHLKKDGRRDNAAHLYGFAAECAVKTALESQGIRVHSGKGIDKPYREHIDLLRGLAAAYLSGKLARLHAILDDPGYFDGWQLSHRYDADGHVDDALCAIYASSAKDTLQAVADHLGFPPP